MYVCFEVDAEFEDYDRVIVEVFLDVTGRPSRATRFHPGDPWEWSINEVALDDCEPTEALINHMTTRVYNGEFDEEITEALDEQAARRRY